MKQIEAIAAVMFGLVYLAGVFATGIALNKPSMLVGGLVASGLSYIAQSVLVQLPEGNDPGFHRVPAAFFYTAIALWGAAVIAAVLAGLAVFF